jgi:hypothetical protein
MEKLPHTIGTLEAAQTYARRGWPVIPLAGKVPAVKKWQLFEATPVNVRYWFGSRRSNVGLRTGSESGYVVVDTDTSEAEDWVLSHLSETPMIALSGNGSTHRYYATPPKKEIRNKQAWNGIQGLDVRGDGGFIVLPGSIHPVTGMPYEWKTGIWLPSGLPAFSPRWVYERRQQVQVSVANVLDPSRLLARGRNYVDRLPVAVSGANGHTTTFVAAIKIVKLVGFNRDAAWDLLRYYNATRCEPAWDEKALLHKLDEALKYAH